MRELRERGSQRGGADGGQDRVREATDLEETEAEQEASGGVAREQPADARGSGADPERGDGEAPRVR